MPAKRIVVLYYNAASQSCRAVLWADVPAGNQIAYVDPTKQSEYPNITPAELQAIRTGLVKEKVVECYPTAGAYSFAAVQPVLQALWTAWQAEVSAEIPWVNFGAYWDNAAVWQPTTGVPMVAARNVPEGFAAFDALTPVLAFTANRLQFVLHNGIPLATGQGMVVKIRALIHFSGKVTATGVAPGAWTVRRRNGTTTPPSGSGGIVLVAHDTADTLPTGIGCWSNPGVVPAGGTLETIRSYVPQADEQKLSTLDAPTMAAFTAWGGQVIYDAENNPKSRPWTIRPGQTLEIVQDATAGTGGGQILCVFNVG